MTTATASIDRPPCLTALPGFGEIDVRWRHDQANHAAALSLSGFGPTAFQSSTTTSVA